jgi:hypothetical protein
MLSSDSLMGLAGLAQRIYAARRGPVGLLACDNPLIGPGLLRTKFGRRLIRLRNGSSGTSPGMAHAILTAFGGGWLSVNVNADAPSPSRHDLGTRASV